MSLKMDRGTCLRVKFGDVVRNVNENVKDPEAAGIDRVIGLEHLDPGELRINRWGELTEETTFTRRVKPGQTLFGKRRAYQRKTAYSEFDAVCSGDILVFESADPGVLHPQLLPFIAMTDGFHAKALETSAGSLSPRTRWSDLATYEFDLPPLAAQRRIADLLWASEQHKRASQATLNCFLVSRRAWTEQIVVPGDLAIADFGEVQVGHAFKSVDFGVVGTRLMRGINVGVEVTRWDPSDTVFYPREPSNVPSQFELQERDFVIPMDRPFTASGELRRAQVGVGDLPALLVQRVARIRPKSPADECLLGLALSARVPQSLLGGSLTGSFAPHLAHGDFKRKGFAISNRVRALDEWPMWQTRLQDLERELRALQKQSVALLKALLVGDSDV